MADDQDKVNPFDHEHPLSPLYGIGLSTAPLPATSQWLASQQPRPYPQINYDPTPAPTPASGYQISSAPSKPEWQQKLGDVGEAAGKAMMAMDPAQSIPYMVMQQPSVVRWGEENPNAYEAINTFLQLGAGHAAGGVQGAMMPWGAAPEHIPYDSLMRRINDRNTVFHNTEIYKLPAIMDDRAIKNMSRGGASVSRLPDINTFNGPITFEIDANHPSIKSSKPIAESGYRKTTEGYGDSPDTAKMNPSYESENRTDKQDIPLEAIKKIWVIPDKDSGLGNNHVDIHQILDFANKAVAGKSIPVETVSRQGLRQSRMLDWMTASQRQRLGPLPGPMEYGKTQKTASQIKGAGQWETSKFSTSSSTPWVPTKPSPGDPKSWEPVDNGLPKGSFWDTHHAILPSDDGAWNYVGSHLEHPSPGLGTLQITGHGINPENGKTSFKVKNPLSYEEQWYGGALGKPKSLNPTPPTEKPEWEHVNHDHYTGVVGSKSWGTVENEIPPNLQYVKKSDLGGTHEAHIFKDDAGNQYMFKPAVDSQGNPSPMMAAADSIASQLQKIGRPGYHVPAMEDFMEVPAKPGSKAAQHGEANDYIHGSVQKLIPGAVSGSYKGLDPQLLEAPEIKALQQEHVIDWLISNHDAHGGQFIRKDLGEVYGIDKSQAFKYFPNDELSTTYHPNAKYGEDEPYYNKMWRAAAEGKMKFNPADSKETIDRLMSIPDDKYRELLEGYASHRFQEPHLDYYRHDVGAGDPPLTPRQKQENAAAVMAKKKFLDDAVDRKNNLAKDFKKFYDGIQEQANKPTTKSKSLGWLDSLKNLKIGFMQ